MTPWLLATLVLLPSLPVLALLTALLERSGPIRMRHWSEEAGGRLRDLFEDPRRFDVFRYSLNLLAKLAPLLLFAAATRSLLERRFPHPLLAAGVAVALIVAVSELASRSLLGRDPEEALRRLTWLYRVALALLWPLLWIARPLAPEPIEPDEVEHEEEASEEEVEAFIEVGTREGILEPEDRDLLWGVVDFGDTQVRSVMTPRVDIVAAPIDEPLERLLDRMIAASVSRMPLYRGSIDQVAGILSLRDLVAGWRRDPKPSAAELVKPPFLVPSTKHLAVLLREFQARRQQLAIVLNEHGGTEGLVTVEDLIEEIVGEIQDEFDDAEPENRLLEDGSLLLDGRASIEILDEFFAWRAEDSSVETVGGLVSGLLGYVPRSGEVLQHGRLRFEVERADERRILVLRVRRSEPPRGEADA